MVDNSYVLEKFPGKGGWTYARIPEVLQDKKSPFGWVKVKGTIDDFAIQKYNLAPMGNGKLFLPVKAEIRKKIKKEEGDSVHVVLYADDEPMVVPQELLLCLQQEPLALNFFNSLTDNEQIGYVKWIYAAKTEEKKVERIADTITKLLIKKEKFNTK